MKRFTRMLGSAAVLTAALATQSLAQTGTGQFNGGGVMYGFTPACINVGWREQGFQVSARFHPNGVGSNGDWESIVLNTQTNSIGTTVYGGSFSGIWQAAEHGGNFSRPWWILQDADNHADIRILAMWPRTVSETTADPVTIRGQIRHMGGTQWCRANFDVIVVQQMN